MKKILSILALGLVLAVGCTKEIEDKVGNLEGRVDKIEKTLGELTSQASGLNTIMTQWQQGGFVSSIQEIEGGHTITFVGGKTVTVLDGPKGDPGDDKTGNPGADGKAPQISVVVEGGVPYWAVDGKILTVNGNKVTVYAPAPQFKIDGDNLMVSFDGTTWTNLGKVYPDVEIPAPVIEKVEAGEESVVFTLPGGATFEIPFAKAFTLVIEALFHEAKAGETIEIPYTVKNGTETTVVEAFGDGLYEASVDMERSVIKVTAPNPIDAGEVLVWADNGEGLSSIKKLVFDEAAVFECETVEFDAPAKGGSVEIPVVSNVEMDVVVEADWLAYVETKAPKAYTIVVSATANGTGLPRTGGVKILRKGTDSVLQSVTVAQKPGTGVATADDLLALAKALDEGTSTEAFENTAGEIVLIDDIDMTGVEWTPIHNLPEGKVFNGQDHKIKNWTSVGVPLFKTVDGTVENLVLDASNVFTINATGYPTVFVVDSLYQTGVLKNVVNNASMQKLTDAIDASNGPKVFHVAFLAHYMNGRLEDCVNNGSIEIDVPSSNGNMWVNGLANFANAKNRLEQDGALIAKNCVNNGNIFVHIASRPKMAYISGVMGGTTVSKYSAQTAIKGSVEGCTNSGNISYGFDETGSGTYYNIGGVCSMVEGKMKDCSNTGNVTVLVPVTGEAPATRPAVGGVAAYVRYGMSGCSNSGTIAISGLYSAGTEDAAGAGATHNPTFGGVVGQYGAKAYADVTNAEKFGSAVDPLENCHNTGKMVATLRMLSKNATHLFFGGVTGFSFTPVKNCSNEGDITVSSTMGTNHVAGVVGKLWNNIEDCWNSGSISYDNVLTVADGGCSKQYFVGGVVGDHNQAGVSMKNCVNKAGATISSVKSIGTTLSYIAGIVARNNAALDEVRGCVNYGDVVTSEGTAVRAGGISGMTNAKVLTDCHNHGNVTAYMNDTQAAAGGLCGFHTYNGTVVSGCTTEGTVTASGLDGSASQFIGGTGNTGQIWDDCTIDGTLVVNDAIVGGFLLGRFVKATDATRLWTVGSTAPMKIKSTATMNGTKIAAVTPVEGNLLGALNGSDPSRVAIAEGGVVIVE